MYNYTVKLQSKQHRPLVLLLKDSSIQALIKKLTKAYPGYSIKALIRKPQ